MYPNQNCGSWLACEGGLTAGQSLADVPQSKLWELACLRRRPDSRPISCRCTPIHGGSEPARDGGLTADPSPASVHIHSCGNGHLGFRPYGESLFQTPKRNQKASPQAYGTSPRLGVPGVHQGASPTVCFATTSSRCVRLRRTALRAHPLMNTSTRPPEGAGGSRSTATSTATARRPTGRPEWLGCVRLQMLIVPTCSKGMHPVTLCVTL